MNPPPIDAYVRWARVLFVVLAAVAVVGLGLVVLGSGLLIDRNAGAAPAFVILALSGAVSLALFIALIVGLGSQRPWAIHAIAPVCYLLIAVGVLRVAVAFSRNEILIPLETIGALLVLTRPHPSESLPSATDDDRRRVLLILLVMVATYVVPYLAPLLVR